MSSIDNPESQKTLAEINHYEQDDHITLVEEGHVYTVDGDSNYISVTNLIREFFPKFDRDKVLSRIFNSDRWCESYKYYGKKREEIKELWNNCRD